MAELNDRLRQARERVESPYASEDCLSRQELAELVNAWVFEHTGRLVELDANDYAHDDAQRMYRFALTCAEDAGDWHLRAQVLCSMAYQASWSGTLDTALAYSESALVRATG